MCGLPRYRWLGIRIGHDRRNELPKFWVFVFEADLEEIRTMVENSEARVPRFVVSPDSDNLTPH